MINNHRTSATKPYRTHESQSQPASTIFAFAGSLVDQHKCRQLYVFCLFTLLLLVVLAALAIQLISDVNRYQNRNQNH